MEIKEEKELETQPLFKSLGQGEFLSNLLSDLELTLKQISSDLIAEPNSSLKLMKVEAELFSWYYGSAGSAINSEKLEYLKSNFQLVKNKSRNTTQEFINRGLLKTPSNVLIPQEKVIEVPFPPPQKSKVKTKIPFLCLMR